MKKFVAFTLSEVIITVGIIGVIAALTVPNLVKNYQKQAQTVKLRKTINEIENAVDMLITEEGKTSLAHTSLYTNANGMEEFFTTHLRVTKTCSSENTSKCFANQEYISINGSQHKTFTCSGNSYILADSSTVCARKISSTTGNDIELYIDTNGTQPPNIGGRDMFLVYIRPDGKIYGSASNALVDCKIVNGLLFCDANSQVEAINRCISSAFGAGCLNKLLNNNWEMDY